jgi:hypothetical protein
MIEPEQDGWIVLPKTSAQVDQEWFYLAKLLAAAALTENLTPTD